MVNLIIEIYKNLGMFLGLTFHNEVLWIVFPLLISTVIMLFYFEKYRDEDPGWNTYVANSLVLFFVAIILLRFIYRINNSGIVNYGLYPVRTVFSFIILIISIMLLFFNFQHFLPEKIARAVSSPLTVNLVAYIAIIYVFSDSENTFSVFSALLLIFILLIVILNLIKIPLEEMFINLKKSKEKEEVDKILKEKKRIEKAKKELKKEGKKKMNYIKKQEKKIKNNHLKKASEKEKQTKKLKKAIKKK
ncbi:hypothetical protein GF386_06625 [Candidatus Pacearchaeota archaeon]|nr:hypothetical protein [Candidatus Pacearchaeota archaeon]MBD3283769.1 hypothetical protein [Candidatus Pacearchaeota archaeon]